MVKRQNIIPYEPVGKMMEGFGSERISHEAKVAMTEHITEYALKIGRLAVKYAAHAGRTTVTDKDVELAAKNVE